MPELFQIAAAKIRCFGRPAALDALAAPAGTLVGRIAPDELVVVGVPGSAAALLESLEGQLAGQGAGALVVDHTDGWSCFSLVGDDVGEVFRRVSHIPLPEPDAGVGEPVFFMGRVCDLACKAFVRGRPAERIDLLFGAEAGHHAEHKLAGAGHAVGLRHVTPPTADPLGTAVGTTGGAR